MKRREFLVASAGLAGSVVPALALGQVVRPCPPSPVGVQGGTSASTSCTPSSAAADWASRISGPGVVWYHPFASADEVAAFCWSNNYPGGNDPNQLARGPSYYDSSLINLNTSDGPAPGFNCMEIIRATGTQETSHWWRPFSPLKGGTKLTGNGRGVGNDDPGANGSIVAMPWTPTTNSETANWGNHGWYANAQYTAANPTAFDGNEYYIQARVKIDPQRAQGINTSIDAGKLFFFTRTDRSATDQECVTTSFHGSTGVDYFAMYRSVGTAWVYNGNSWQYPLGQWVTLLFHVKPGTMTGSLGSVTPNPNTTVEVWAARPGETAYTLITSQSNITLPFDVQWGHNALMCSTYQNNSSMTQFYHRFAQIIFSKSFIPCPQV